MSVFLHNSNITITTKFRVYFELVMTAEF